MQVSDTRCYGEKIDIDNVEVKNFWDERAKNAKDLNTVLLGNQKSSHEGDLRNKEEFELVESVLGKLENISILDIGCGMGRWANNLKNRKCNYTGIDYSEEFTEFNKKNYPSMKFYTMAAHKIDLSKLEKTYDLVIINGVLMYINDEELNDVFDTVSLLNPKNVYLQESVSVINERLTLNKFYSQELNKNYSAIYRKPEEYQKLLDKYLSNYKIVESDLLLDEKSGARKETNAKYWILTREK